MSKLLKERWNRLAFGKGNQSLNESETQEIRGWQSLSQAIGQEGAENLEQTFYEENEQATDVDRYEAACENYITNIWTFKDNPAAVAFAMREMGNFWSNDEGGYDDDDGYYY